MDGNISISVGGGVGVVSQGGGGDKSVSVSDNFVVVVFLLSLLSCPQLPGRLFSPSDISKKLSHHFLLHFPIGMGSYDHHAKYQGVFMDLL